MIQIGVDAKGAIRAIANLAKQQRYAAALTLNRVAEEANVAIRKSVQHEFTVRERRMLNWVAPQQLPKFQRATRENLNAIIQTEGKGKILNPFEIGQSKVGKSDDVPVAIPTQQLRHNDATVIPRKWYPSSLGLTPRRDPTGKAYYALGRGAIANRKTPFGKTKGGKVTIKGKHNTFVLDPRHHDGVSMRQWGVYQRIGPKKGDIRMLWRYKRQVPRPKSLHFEEIARKVVYARFAAIYKGALAHALKTAK